MPAWEALHAAVASHAAAAHRLDYESPTYIPLVLPRAGLGRFHSDDPATWCTRTRTCTCTCTCTTLHMHMHMHVHMHMHMCMWGYSLCHTGLQPPARGVAGRGLTLTLTLTLGRHHGRELCVGVITR